MGKTVAYRRVSTNKNTNAQKTERQLFDTGIKFDLEFEDKMSGTNASKRAGLQECLSILEKGDELVCHSIDRLARNTADLLNITRDLLDRGVKITFYKEKLSFGGDNGGLSEAIDNVLLTILSAIHTFGATMIKESVKDGIDRVRAVEPEKLSKKKGTKWHKTFTANKAKGLHATTRNREASRKAKEPVARKVSQIIRYSEDRMNIKQIADVLNKEGFLTPRNKPWSEANTSNLIKEFNIPYKKKSLKA